MELSYRGAKYESTSEFIEVIESQTGVKYRGVNGRITSTLKGIIFPSIHHLNYRANTY